MVRQLLHECFVFYQNWNLSNDCDRIHCRVPAECAQHNAIYNILHYLVDNSFITENVSVFFLLLNPKYANFFSLFSLFSLHIQGTSMHLSTAMIFTPIARSTKALPLYYQLEKK